MVSGLLFMLDSKPANKVKFDISFLRVVSFTFLFFLNFLQVFLYYVTVILLFYTSIKLK